MKKVRAIIFFACYFVLLVIPIFPFDSQKVQLKADHVRSDESTKILIASGNVEIKYGDIGIKAPKIQWDTINNFLWGAGDIEVSRKEDTFLAQFIYLDLNKNIIKLRGIDMAIKQPDIKELLYLKAGGLEDTGQGVKRGKNGFFTSCNQPEPHYFIYSSYFEYYPDNRIIGFNNILYSPLLFLPIPLWTPIYVYELGERRIIWNFPTIGKKETTGWGYFMQNKVDYDNVDGKDSSIFVDWYQNKGIGLGLRHQYKFQDNKGEAYYYKLEEADTKEQNEKIEFAHEYKINETMKLSADYDRIDAERINSSGRQRKEGKSFNFTYDDLGDIYRFSLKENQDYNMNVNSINTDFSHSFNRQNLFSTNLNKRDNIVRGEEYINSTISNYIPLPAQMSIKNTFKFDSVDPVKTEQLADTKLISNTRIEKIVNKDFKVGLTFDHLWDIDEYKVTSDITKNDFFYRMPELKMRYNNINFGPFQLSEEVVIARYQEVKYNTLKNDRIKTPGQDNFGLAPNTYIFKQTANTSFSGFNLNTAFDQYIFSTPGKGLLEGDAMISGKINANYNNTFFNFMKTSTSYSFSEADGNTPFYEFDGIKNIRINKLNETLTFFWENESKYKWYHKTGYNWVTEKMDYYNTGILLSPIKEFRFKADSGMDPKEKKKTGIVSGGPVYYYELLPLSWEFEVAPTSNIKLLYKMTQDLNNGLIKYSNFKLNFSLGDDPQYRWDISTFFMYSTFGQMREILADRYIMETIQVTKYDHCRKFALSYNKRREEIKFTITINAFPEDEVGFKKNKETWKVEGILDDPSAERF
ncbi:hypothetical protein ACFLZV_04265 [Candidatus Margulisiibacteriota bacterium]